MPRDWKAEIAALRMKPTDDVGAAVRRILIEACGRVMSLRAARGRLFLISTAAVQGRPQMFELERRQLVIMSIDDFAEVICEPSLDEFFTLFHGKKPGPRRRVTNR